MSALDGTSVRSTLSARPLPERARFMVAVHSMPMSAVAAAGIVAVVTVAFVSGRVLAVNLRFDIFVDSTEIARALGAVSFLSIAAIVAAILLGRRALDSLRDSERLARHVTTLVVGVAYLHLVLWGTRTIAASVAAASAASPAEFLPALFWWG